MGIYYWLGKGVARDDKEAFAWFSKAAKQNSVLGQYGVGNSYLRGRGVRRDVQKAVEWFHRAAEQGYGKGQSTLADCYTSGTGTEADFVEAYKWATLAANQGNQHATELLAWLKEDDRLTRAQVDEAERRVAEFNERHQAQFKPILPEVE